MTEEITAIGTLAAAIAAAAAAGISMRQAKLLAGEADLARAVARFELFHSLEHSYGELYPRLWHELGPWDDGVEVEPELRRCVHDLASNLSSVYNAQTLGVVDHKLADYVAQLYIDWLRTPKAREVWSAVFAHQSSTWPAGFVDWVEDLLGPEIPDDAIQPPDLGSANLV